MQQYHARPKTSPFGDIMATNLSSFPSALTVIAVSDGDIRKHRQEFIVNEDLKRLGCSGRSGMTLSEPTRATQEKFQTMYRTSERIPFCESVVELIKQCQTALFLFGMLEAHYIDGLLCDVTETAIGDWWTEVGAEYYNAEPTDGILGPSTVAALLGMLMGARNRLAWYGASVSKDVFDINYMKKGIGSFQKDMKLERTRRLDHQTLRRLHGATIKAAAGEGGWGVQKAIKSTVEGFGGKRGELVFGMVGGKDKGNVGDIETLDIDKFVSLIYGPRTKWLWYGKTRRSPAATSGAPGSDHYHESGNDIGAGFFSKEETPALPSRRAYSEPQDGEDTTIAAAAATPRSASAAAATGPARTNNPSEPPSSGQAPIPGSSWPLMPGTDPEGFMQRKDSRSTMDSAVPPSGSAPSVTDNMGERDRDSKTRTVFKSVTGRVNDARSGLGRIRDAVGGGLRGHASRPSRDDLGTPSTAMLYGPDGAASGGGNASTAAASAHPGIATLAQASLNSPVMVGRAFTWKNKPEEYLNGMRRERDASSKDTPDATRSRYGENMIQPQSASQVALSGRPREPQLLKPPDTAAVVAATTAALEAELASRIPGSMRANGRASHLRLDLPVSTTANTSVAGSVAGDSDLEGPLLETERCVGPAVVGLLRRHSIASSKREPPQLPYEVVWPRRLSFSAAEEAILTWEELVEYGGAGWGDSSSDDDDDDSDDDDDNVEDSRDGTANTSNANDSDADEDLVDEAAIKRKAIKRAAACATSPAALAKFMTAPTLERDLYKDLAMLKDVVGRVVAERVGELETLDGVYAGQVEDVQAVFFQLSDAYERVQANSQELLEGERAQGTEAVREVEMLMARVEYEIGSLASKVQDVEEGVRLFEQQVEHVEQRAEELKRQLETESWLHWLVRSMTGIGTGPNIVGE